MENTNNKKLILHIDIIPKEIPREIFLGIVSGSCADKVTTRCAYVSRGIKTGVKPFGRENCCNLKIT